MAKIAPQPLGIRGMLDNVKIYGSAFRTSGRADPLFREDAMWLRICGLIAVCALTGILGSAQSLAQNAYISNLNSSTVSVINMVTNSVIATIPVGNQPQGVAVTPDGSKVYVANVGSNSLSVINTVTNSVIATIPVGNQPQSLAVTPDSSKVYVANQFGTVSVINTVTNSVIATIPVGNQPQSLAVTPDGSKVYVANLGSNSLSVIATATNTVVTTIPVGNAPFAFIQPPPPRFAGMPGKTNCYGQSVAALAAQFSGVNAAASALGYSDALTVQNAILRFCGG